MPKTNYVYCDANVFLAYFNKEAGRIDTIDPFFDEVQKDNQRKIVTSVFSITEVSHVAEEKHRSRLNQAVYEGLEAFWGDSSLIEFVDYSERLARQARDLIRRAISLSYALRTNDAVHLISAQFVGVTEFLTYDAKLQKFGPLLQFDVREPYVLAPRLPLKFDDDPDPPFDG